MKKFTKILLPIASAIAVAAPTICLASCGATKVDVDKWSPSTFSGSLVSDGIRFKKNKKYNFYVNFDAVEGGEKPLENAILEFPTDFQIIKTENIKAYWVDQKKEYPIQIDFPLEFQIRIIQKDLDTKIPGVFFENIIFGNDMSGDSLAIFHFN